MKTKAFFILYIFCSLYFAQNAFSQSDSIEVRMFNRSGKDVFLSLGYYKEIDDLPILCTYGWFRVEKGKQTIINLPAISKKPIYYHAHNTADRNDNWGGSTFLMVHPSVPFSISYADNAAIAKSLEKNLSQEEITQLEAYPFREVKKNPKGYFQLNLIN